MSSSYKNVAFNTIILYCRTFLSMLLTLYSSRILLEYIGVTDFGIFSLVGGVIIMFGFFNNAMSAASQRFITVEKAKDTGDVNSIFNISLIIHIILAIIILILLETIGLWFLNNTINIPSERFQATVGLYHILAINLFVSIINVPYNAILVAYEKMNIIALIGILESVLKLIGILLIQFVEFDKLVFFSIVLLSIALINRGIYFYYCNKAFKEQVRVNFSVAKNKIKEMIAFAFWNLFGVIAAMGYNQGVNIILNLYFNVVVNAARGIAFQIYQSFYTITNNIQLATNAFITHSYVNRDNYENKVINIIRFLCSLFLLLIIPFFNNASDILTIWLGDNIPEGAEIFAKLLLIDLFIQILSGPIHTMVQAEGNIKHYQVFISFILLLNLPLSYIILKVFQLPEVTFVISIFLSFFALVYRLFYIKRKFEFNILRLIKSVLGLLIIGILIFYLSNNLRFNLNNVYLDVLINILATLLIAIILLISLATNIDEKKYILRKLHAKF